MNRFFKTQRGALLAGVVLLAGSCATPRNTTYLQDMDYGTPYDALPATELKLQQGDRLSITVFSDDAALTAPFNLTASTSALEGGEGSRSTTLQYEIDNKGYIDFPVLGSIRAEGLTLKKLKSDLEGRIRETGYIKNPVVEVSMENFTVTVLGAAGNRVVTVDREQVNLLQIIAMAGGTGGNTKIDDVMVIRTEGGKRTAYQVNLKSKGLYDSPAFYLQQNDVVYIKPKGSTLSASGQTVMTIVGSSLTLASIITNFLLWRTR